MKIQTLFLAVIALVVSINLGFTIHDRFFRSVPELKPKTATVTPPTETVMRVIARSYAAHPGDGGYDSGYIVEGPQGLDYIEKNFEGYPSLLPDTKYIRRVKVENNVYYEPLILSDL